MKPLRDLVVVRSAPAALLNLTEPLQVSDAEPRTGLDPQAVDAEQGHQQDVDGAATGRAAAPVPADELRADPPDGGAGAAVPGDPAAPIATMTVRFAPYGVWYEVNSWWEGRFLERIMPGAFSKTMVGRKGQIKVLFDHGMDFRTGDRPIGPIDILEDRTDSPYAEVAVLDTSDNRDLVPGLAAGVYGSSFMFQVLQEFWDDEPEPSEHNPRGLPERSITEVKLLEFGPVTWPANPTATSGLRSSTGTRSGTDWFCDRLRKSRPERFEVLAARLNDFRAQHGFRTPEDEAARADGAGTSDDGAANSPTDAPDSTAEHHAIGIALAHQRKRYLDMQKEGVSI